MNINNLMKQAKVMQDKMVTEQARIAAMEFEGSAGGGMVKLTITGKGHMLAIHIDPSLVNKDEVEMLEDLILAAFNDAKKKADSQSDDAMAGMMGGMKLPAGFKMPSF
jgi:DNA-binding YbaB/EbfC family protein